MTWTRKVDINLTPIATIMFFVECHVDEAYLSMICPIPARGPGWYGCAYASRDGHTLACVMCNIMR